MANTTGKKFGGRKKGTPNKATENAREAIADFINGNVGRLNNWLDQIAEDNPKDAFNCFMSVVEYNIPKLARTENYTNINAKVDASLKVGYVDAKDTN